MILFVKIESCKLANLNCLITLYNLQIFELQDTVGLYNLLYMHNYLWKWLKSSFFIEWKIKKETGWKHIYVVYSKTTQ